MTPLGQNTEDGVRNSLASTILGLVAMPGVTWNVNITYLSAVPKRTETLTKEDIVKFGKSLCLLEGRIRKVDGLVLWNTPKPRINTKWEANRP